MKALAAVALFVAVLGAFTGMIWYVSFRLRTLLGLKRQMPIRIAIAIIFIISIWLTFYGTRAESTAMGALCMAGGYFFSFFTFLTILLLILHAIQLRLNLPTKLMASLVIAAAVIMTMVGAWQGNDFTVTETEITLDGLKDDVVVMHISDVHVGNHRGKEYLAKIARKTNERNPDIVLINGDLVDARIALKNGSLSPLNDFNAPVYFTDGNHETYIGRERVLKAISNHGVRALHNEVVDTSGIYLVGLDYMKPDENTFDMHPSVNNRTIKNTLQKLAIAKDKPSVLVHHSPVGVEYVSEKGVDLMLSGHTHAGQVFPANLLVSLFFPFSKGLYEEGDTKVFVSQGAGTYGPRIRLGAKNEINLIRLKGKE